MRRLSLPRSASLSTITVSPPSPVSQEEKISRLQCELEQARRACSEALVGKDAAETINVSSRQVIRQLEKRIEKLRNEVEKLTCAVAALENRRAIEVGVLKKENAQQKERAERAENDRSQLEEELEKLRHKRGVLSPYNAAPYRLFSRRASERTQHTVFHEKPFDTRMRRPIKS